jgi:hypothetical protein
MGYRLAKVPANKTSHIMSFPRKRESRFLPIKLGDDKGEIEKAGHRPTLRRAVFFQCVADGLDIFQGDVVVNLGL